MPFASKRQVRTWLFTTIITVVAVNFVAARDRRFDLKVGFDITNGENGPSLRIRDFEAYLCQIALRLNQWSPTSELSTSRQLLGITLEPTQHFTNVKSPSHSTIFYQPSLSHFLQRVSRIQAKSNNVADSSDIRQRANDDGDKGTIPTPTVRADSASESGDKEKLGASKESSVDNSSDDDDHSGSDDNRRSTRGLNAAEYEPEENVKMHKYRDPSDNDSDRYAGLRRRKRFASYRRKRIFDHGYKYKSNGESVIGGKSRKIY